MSSLNLHFDWTWQIDFCCFDSNFKTEYFRFKLLNYNHFDLEYSIVCCEFNGTSSHKQNVFIAPALNSRFSQSRVSLHESSARARWSERNKNCLVASSFISFLTVGFFAFSSRYYFSIEFNVILICFWMSHVPLLRFFSIPPMNNIVILLHHPR